MNLPRIRFAMAVMLLSCAAFAQQPARLDAVVDVSEDGSVVAAERLQLASTVREPLHWRMPAALTSPNGVRRLLFVDVLELIDGRGHRIQSITQRFGDHIDVLIPVQPLSDDTGRITYEIRNAVAFRLDRGELFWRIGSGWANPLQNVSVNITIPDSAVGKRPGRHPRLRPSCRQLRTPGAGNPRTRARFGSSRYFFSSEVQFVTKVSGSTVVSMLEFMMNFCPSAAGS